MRIKPGDRKAPVVLRQEGSVVTKSETLAIIKSTPSYAVQVAI
jgi:hypothetical protein